MSEGHRGASKLTVENVGMNFGENQVLEGVNLDLAAREFVVLIGGSGCGKTTLLNLVAGFLLPTEGEIAIDGRSIEEPGSDRAMVFQDDAVFPWYTVQQNVEYGLKVRGLPKSETRKRAQEHIELVGLRGHEGAYPAQLSGGMRKRVDVARALALEPELLLMDEPFAALDAITKARLQEEFVRLWQDRDSTVLFVTHDIEEALFLGDRVLLMGSGRIVKEISVPFGRPRTEEVRTSSELQEARAELIENLRDLSTVSSEGERK